MEFKFRHPDSGEERSVFFSEKQIRAELTDLAYESLSCGCEPIGETTVVECGCDDYICEFELVDEPYRVQEGEKAFAALLALSRAFSDWPMHVSDEDEELISRMLKQAESCGNKCITKHLSQSD